MAKPSIVIGVSGGSGSGKTSILNHLLNQYQEGEMCIVSQDNYYKPIEEQSKDQNGEINFDLPEAIDLDRFLQDMIDLEAGRPVFHDEYTFNNADREAEKITVNPAKILIIEGLFIFHFQPIATKLNLKIFVDTKQDLRLSRRIKRDGEERGYSKETVNYQWENHVEPAYQNFLEPYKNDCQLVVENNGDLNLSIASVKKLIDDTLA
ncbi:MAG: uridine kinase [Patiriisocius sp.]|jgi:uridine kinase